MRSINEYNEWVPHVVRFMLATLNYENEMSMHVGSHAAKTTIAHGLESHAY